MILNKKWFTLIEMLIAITIFLIFVVLTYVNYAYYQNISQVKLTLKDISQNLSIARNMAINWIQNWGLNQSVWIYIEKESNNLKYFLYNYTGSVLDVSWEPYKKVNLKPNIKIADIKLWWDYTDNILILFESITWKTDFYKYDWTNFSLFGEKIVEFDVSFKNAVNFPLKRSLKYFKNTNITDY